MQQRSTDDVRAALQELGLSIQIQTFTESTATSEQAAATIGTSIGSIVKSLCFMVDGRPVMILASGDKRVDSKKIAAHFDVAKKRVKIASTQETLEATGYLPGGVPPIGHSQPLPVLIDDSLQRYEMVYSAAGSPNAIFPIPLALLVQITGGAIISLVIE